MATHYKFSDILAVIKTSAGEFSNNNSFRHAAALSYYTIFSLPPLLLIVITLASSVYAARPFRGRSTGSSRAWSGPIRPSFCRTALPSSRCSSAGR